MTSVILPVFNCDAQLRSGIPRLLKIFRSADMMCEIIVVDDGSKNKDSVKKICEEFGCVCIVQSLNLGKGAAVKKGILSARGDIIMFMDGDFPFDLSIITDILAEFRNSDTNIVIGDRSLPESRYPKISFLRTVGSKILSMLIAGFIQKGLSDSQCGIKAFRRKVAVSIFEQITLKDFSFDVEVLFLARLKKIKMVRLPVRVNDQDVSTVRVLRDGKKMLAGLFRIVKNYLFGKYQTDE